MEWMTRVYFPAGTIMFFSSSPPRSYWLWCPPNLPSNGGGGLFPGGKAIRAWSWPLTSI